MKKSITSAILAVALVSATGMIISAPANAAVKKPAAAAKEGTKTQSTEKTTKPVKPAMTTKPAPTKKTK